MIGAWFRWPLGLATSLLLHGTGALTLATLLAPSPRPSQQPQKSALTLESYRVPRTQAIAQPAKGQPTPPQETMGTGLGPEALPRTRARPVRPSALELADRQAPLRLPEAASAPPALHPVAPVSQKTLPTFGQATRISAAQTPAPVLATAVPSAAEVILRPPSAQTLTPLGASGLTLPLSSAEFQTQQATPAKAEGPRLSVSPAPSVALQAAQPTPQIARDSAVAPESVFSHAPAQQELVPAQTEALHVSAALAFQGTGNDELDPVSITAFQSLLRLGDETPKATSVSNALQEILHGVPCSRLQVVFDPNRVVLDVRGHLPSEQDRHTIITALRAQMGADIAVSDNMRLLPHPQCGALSAIEKVGLPQSTEQITNPLLVGADTYARVFDYSNGQWLFFDLQAPDYAAFIYVDYFDANGNVIHLRPSPQDVLEPTPAKTKLRIGVESPEEPGLQIRIGPPFGQEIAVAFAASHRLDLSSRPLIEPASPYLEELRRETQKNQIQHADFKGEWVYFLISTHP